jgi:hypothetical protein
MSGRSSASAADVLLLVERHDARRPRVVAARSRPAAAASCAIAMAIVEELALADGLARGALMPVAQRAFVDDS